MIKVEPGEVRRVGSDVTKKKSETEALIDAANKMMVSLRDQFQGKRSQAIYTEWEQIHPRLLKALPDLERTGQLLKSAADAFEEVDNAGVR
jgi:WXG100 family type VII secretion target